MANRRECSSRQLCLDCLGLPIQVKVLEGQMWALSSLARCENFAIRESLWL